MVRQRNGNNFYHQRMSLIPSTPVRRDRRSPICESSRHVKQPNRLLAVTSYMESRKNDSGASVDVVSEFSDLAVMTDCLRNVKDHLEGIADATKDDLKDVIRCCLSVLQDLENGDVVEKNYFSPESEP